MTTYTLNLKKMQPGNKVVFVSIKHCVKIGDIWYRPVAYANGEPERMAVENPDEQIGWEYVELDYNGYRLDGVEKE